MPAQTYAVFHPVSLKLTLQYEACVSSTEPDRVLIYERYPTKDALVDPHRKSPLFAWVCYVQCVDGQLADSRCSQSCARID